jgi:hypothetical protein
VSEPIVLGGSRNAIAARGVEMRLESGPSGKLGGGTAGQTRANAAVETRVVDTERSGTRNEKGYP